MSCGFQVIYVLFYKKLIISFIYPLTDVNIFVIIKIDKIEVRSKSVMFLRCVCQSDPKACSEMWKVRLPKHRCGNPEADCSFNRTPVVIIIYDGVLSTYNLCQHSYYIVWWAGFQPVFLLFAHFLCFVQLFRDFEQCFSEFWHINFYFIKEF